MQTNQTELNQFVHTTQKCTILALINQLGAKNNEAIQEMLQFNQNNAQEN